MIRRNGKISEVKVKKMQVDDNFYEYGFLNQNCVTHSDEPIRFYCKDDMSPLCAVCITDHASHDFIVADYKAVNTVRQKLVGCLSNLDMKMLEYKSVAR